MGGWVGGGMDGWMGWDGMGWDGMGQDGMGRDRMGFLPSVFAVSVCFQCFCGVFVQHTTSRCDLALLLFVVLLLLLCQLLLNCR